MKRVIRSSVEKNENQIQVTMYLHPIIYAGSEVLGAVTFDKKDRRYHTDINPDRVINGPLSGPGEALENPIKDEWESFIEDCKFVIKEVGFTIIASKQSDVSKKSEYILTYGIGDTPCGTIACNLRISDHPFNATFPEESKDKVLEYFKENKILDGSATRAGIDFQVEKITIGSVKSDSWDVALQRLYEVMKKRKRNV